MLVLVLLSPAKLGECWQHRISGSIWKTYAMWDSRVSVCLLQKSRTLATYVTSYFPPMGHSSLWLLISSTMSFWIWLKSARKYTYRNCHYRQSSIKPLHLLLSMPKHNQTSSTSWAKLVRQRMAWVHEREGQQEACLHIWIILGRVTWKVNPGYWDSSKLFAPSSVI